MSREAVESMSTLPLSPRRRTQSERVLGPPLQLCLRFPLGKSHLFAPTALSRRRGWCHVIAWVCVCEQSPWTPRCFARWVAVAWAAGLVVCVVACVCCVCMRACATPRVCVCVCAGASELSRADRAVSLVSPGAKMWAPLLRPHLCSRGCVSDVWVFFPIYKKDAGKGCGPWRNGAH